MDCTRKMFGLVFKVRFFPSVLSGKIQEEILLNNNLTIKNHPKADLVALTFKSTLSSLHYFSRGDFIKPLKKFPQKRLTIN